MKFFNITYILLCLSNFFNNKYHKIIFILFIMLFYFLSFLRWETGTDWENYLITFQVSEDISQIIHVKEYGFKLLNHIVKNFTDNYTVFLFISATIIFILKGYTIWKLSLVPLLSLLMSFCLFQSDIYFVRQNIAAAILFFSIKYILNKKLIKFLICICLATLIHQTAMIFIICYFLINNITASKKIYILFFIIAIIVSLNIEKILIFFSLILPKSYADKIIFYLSLQNYNFGYKTYMSKNMIILSASLNRIFLLFIYSLFRKKFPLYIKKIFFIYYIGFLLFLVFTPISLSLGRIVYYFDFMQLIIFPSIYKLITKKTNKIIFLSIFYLYCYLKMLSAISAFYKYYIPYKSIFQR